MRALLILAVLGPMAVLIAWGASRQALAAIRRKRHIAELEAENRRLDRLTSDFPRSTTRGVRRRK